MPHHGVKRVVVIGCGVAGLQVIRRLSEADFQVLALEGNGEVGGVWSKNYYGYCLQCPWDLYTFPDFPYPEHLRPATTYPTGLEVQAYIRAYAEHFSLHQHIKLNCRLLQLRPGPHGQGWRVLYLDCVADRFYSVAADFVVMATGIYNQPLIPRIENEAEFKGQCTHAKHFTDPSLADNKDVVVVGAGKTAVDVQTMLAASKRARSVTALLRQGHWPVPRQVHGLSIRSIVFNRAIVDMLPPYYTSKPSAQVMHKAIKPVKRLFWRWFEGYIQADFNLSAERLPMERLPRDLFSGSQILDNKAAKWIMPGAVPTVRGSIQSFTANGILLQDGSFLRADLVLFCTGYTKSYEYLPGTLRAKLDLQKDGLYLYRNIIPPCIPNLAFIGAEVSTYNNILTSGLQSLWLTALLQGRVQLPPVQVMQADVKEQQRWKRKVMPAQQHRGCVLMLYMQCYHDQLVTDLGLSPYRKVGPMCCLGLLAAWGEPGTTAARV
ncbi:flavin-containing monooxygenase [Haematococcus lacustris]